MSVNIARRTQRHTSQVLREANFAKTKGWLNGSDRNHVLLVDLPRTALPADVRRLCAKQRFDHVSKVALDYYRFSPTGRAWVTISDANHTEAAVKVLKNCNIGGAMIKAHAAEPVSERPSRTRGPKGRMEAAERGIIPGTGPDTGIPHQGRCVVMYGLPGQLTVETLRAFLKSFKLAGMENGQKEVIKVELDPDNKNPTSRFFVRLASVAEAHRLVRRLHMTHYQPDHYGTRCPIHAHVIY